jgi:hypothetical protein
MPTIIDSLIVTLGLDPSDFEKQAAEAQRALDKEKDAAVKRGKEIEAGSRKQREGFVSAKNELLGFLAVFGGVGAIKSFATALIQGDAAAGRLSRNIGVTTEKIAAWQGVLRGAGGTTQDASNDLSLLASAYQQILLTGESPLFPYMRLLGLTVTDLKDPAEALLKIADAFQKMPKERAAELGRQMGFSPAMISTLQRGREEITNLVVEQEKFNLVNKETADQAEKTQREIENLKTSWEGLGREIMTASTPALQGFVDLMRWVVDNRRYLDVGFAGQQARAGLIDQMLGRTPAAATGGGQAATGGGGQAAKFNEIAGYFKGKGYPDAQARGIAAGVLAESQGNPTAFNPKGGGEGAYGIGQWRGPRLKKLRERYGRAPTMAQQLEFLHWELQGGDVGGASVRRSTTEQEALRNYIGSSGPNAFGFMRPAPGAEVEGDLRRGQAALNAYKGTGARTTTVTVQTLNVQTQAKDADGIAKALPGALQRLVPQFNIGVF